MVECWAKGFSPSNITFSWTRDGKEIRAPQNLIINRTADGLYDGLSQLLFIPALADENSTYACVVNHESLEKPLEREFRLTITSEFLILLISKGKGCHWGLYIRDVSLTPFIFIIALYTTLSSS